MTQVDDKHAAYEVLLLLADADARWWDYGNAVRLLDHAADARGGLPPEYEFKRARWARLRDEPPENKL
jgi:predicted dienelactone hydrolase